MKLLKKKIYENLKLSISIRDLGKSGAPPYNSDLRLNGFIQLELNAHENSKDRWWKEHDKNEKPEYTANFEITQPKIIKEISPDLKEIETSISLNSEIFIETVGNYIKLNDDNDLLQYLRNININISIIASVNADSLYNQHHFIIRKINDVKGTLTIELKSNYIDIKPFETNDFILGIYKAELNINNSPFKLNSFVEPNMNLTRTDIDWNIDVENKLEFK